MNKLLYRDSKKSFMLVIVLIILVILSIFGLYIGQGSRQKIIVVKRLSELNALRMISQAAVNKGIVAMSKDILFSSDSFIEEWLNSESSFRDVKIGLGSFNLCYNYSGGDLEFERCGVIDESRKIDINKVSRKVIKKLLQKVLDIDGSQAQALAASVIDFRDSGSELSIPRGSGEDSYYRNLVEPYDCKDGDFEVIDELLLVKGMNADYFDKLSDFITIYGQKGVNINTASALVLSAVGIDKRLLDKIMEYRRGVDGLEGTPDDNIFLSPSAIVSQLSQNQNLSISEVANISNLVSDRKLGCSSKYFMVKAKASLDYSSAKMSVEAVFDREGNILFWREK